MSVNTGTHKFHIENDSTYNVISIPKQVGHVENKTEYTFCFNAQDKHNVSVRLTEDISCVFSEILLTHLQSYNHGSSTRDELFIIFASCGSQHLFPHIKKIVTRKHNN